MELIGGGQQGNPQANATVSAKDLQDVVCEECGGMHFVPTFFMKKISALVSPSGQESFLPMQTWKCDSCSHINSDFIPKD